MMGKASSWFMSAVLFGTALGNLPTRTASAEEACGTRVVVECGKGVPQDACELLKSATPQAFVFRSKHGGSACGAFPSPPQISFSYSAAGMVVHIPLTPEVAKAFGLAVTEYRRVKGKNTAFNSEDSDEVKWKAAIDKDDYDTAARYQPFRFSFNKLDARFVGFKGLLGYYAAGYHNEKGDFDRIAKFQKRIDPFMKVVRVVLDADGSTFESVPLSPEADKQGLESITIKGKTTKRDAAGFPAEFERAKGSLGLTASNSPDPAAK